MTLSPYAGPMTRAAVAIRNTYVDLPDRGGYYWNYDYTIAFWKRIGITLILLGLPVALISLTTYSLLGYLALLAIPAGVKVGKGKIHHTEADNRAAMFYANLNGKHAEFGDLLRKQIWDHNCGRKGNVNYGHKARTYVYCEYCDNRLVELYHLEQSVLKEKARQVTLVDDAVLESSREWRKAMDEQPDMSELMKEIEAGAK